MRYTLALAAAVLFTSSVLATDPPITFQTQPLDRLLGDLRTATEQVGGEKAVKSLNDGIKEKLGAKGFDGLDLNKPIVGYILLAPKAEDIVGVVAFPVTGEKEFLALCERMNGQKVKDLGKGLYEVPATSPELKARMRFAEGHAYIAAGKNPEPALDAKALVAPGKLQDPRESAAFAAKLHFDRLTPEVKAALVTLLLDAKKSLQETLGNAPDAAALKPVFAELEKLAKRYLILLNGADTAALRLNFDATTGDVAVEATLTPKPNTELAKQIAARKPGENQFAGLLTPDTVAGAYYSAPLFADELRDAFGALSEQQQKDLAQNLQLPEAAKATIEELSKGQARTLKSGTFDFFMAVRGPNKDGHYSAVAAMSFEDPSALEKEFKKFMESDGPPEAIGTFKWNADKAGTVNIHTFKLNGANLPPPVKIFGDAPAVAFAFAPKAIYVTFGPDAVAALQDALKAKPAETPAFDLVVNPAKLAKLVEAGGGAAATIERAIGKENKLISATSIRVTSGKDLSLRFALNLKVIPRAIASLGTVRD
jgi:hypothetical protein